MLSTIILLAAFLPCIWTRPKVCFILLKPFCILTFIQYAEYKRDVPNIEMDYAPQHANVLENATLFDLNSGYDDYDNFYNYLSGWMTEHGEEDQ